MYQKRTNKQNSEDAVSPVVAVMLMLVVTIVIAALVAAFATGVMGEQKAAPVVTASVDLNTKQNDVTLSFMSVSEPVAKSDLQLILKLTEKYYNSSSKNDEYTYYSQVGILGESGVINSGAAVKKTLALAEGDGTGGKYIDPTVTVGDVLGGTDATKNKYFASYTVKNATNDKNFDLYVGGVLEDTNITNKDSRIDAMMKVQCKQKTEPGLSAMGSYEGQYFTCNPGYKVNKNENLLMTVKMANLKAGDKVDVELVHLPSGSVIYAKTVTVGA